MLENILTQLFHDHQDPVVQPTLAFVAVYLSAPVELTTHYTTADKVLEIGVLKIAAQR